MGTTQLRIALTGGPCSGKTSIVHQIKQKFTKVVSLPESATMLLSGGFPRDKAEPIAHVCFQTAVFQVQTQLENVFDLLHPGKVQVVDRGTIDGAAYWPGGPQGFFESLKTTKAQQLQRYSHVVFLDSPDAETFEQKKRENPCRSENYEQTVTLSEKTFSIWKDHPRITRVCFHPAFEDKIKRVFDIISHILEG